MNKRVKLGLREWSSQLTAHKTFITDHLSNFFHFKKHEYLAVDGLIQ